MTALRAGKFRPISRFSVFFIAKRDGISTIAPDMKHFITAAALATITFALASCCCW